MLAGSFLLFVKDLRQRKLCSWVLMPPGCPDQIEGIEGKLPCAPRCFHINIPAHARFGQDWEDAALLLLLKVLQKRFKLFFQYKYWYLFNSILQAYHSWGTNQYSASVRCHWTFTKPGLVVSRHNPTWLEEFWWFAAHSQSATGTVNGTLAGA